MEHYEPKSISPEQLEKVKTILNNQKEKNYKITAKVISNLEITIQAANYDEAVKIAENELITEEFDVVASEFVLGDVIEINN